MKKMKWVAILCWPLLALGCPVDVPTPNTPAKHTDDVCERACDNLERLQCPEAKPVEGGKTCPEFCEQTKRDPRLRLNPECVANAKTRGELVVCKVRCLQ